MIERNDIQKLAALARIDVSETDIDRLKQEIESIVSYVSEIQKASGGELQKEAGSLRNVMREDGEPHPSGEFTEILLEDVPKREGDYVKVKKIINQD